MKKLRKYCKLFYSIVQIIYFISSAETGSVHSLDLNAYHPTVPPLNKGIRFPDEFSLLDTEESPNSHLSLPPPLKPQPTPTYHVNIL